MRRTPAFNSSLTGCLLLAAFGGLSAQPRRAAAAAELPPPAQTEPEQLSVPPASGAMQPAAQAQRPHGDATEPQQRKQREDKQGQDANAKQAANKESPPPDGRCDLCGSCECVRKVCVSKPTTKEIRKVCWDARREDFCVAGRSVWCGKVCRQDDCGCWTHDLWKPTCAEVLTRVVPVRKETKRTVPAVEWTVEERCNCCRRRPQYAVGAPEADGERPDDAGTAERKAAMPRTLP